MFQSDFLMRQIEDITKVIANLVFDKGIHEVQIFEEENDINGFSIFLSSFYRMIDEDKINEAEDLLFEELEKRPDPELLKIATDFYKKLATMSDEKLDEVNFGREEIEQGIKDILELYKNKYNIQGG